MDTVTNIPVVTGATACELPSGEVVILVVNQGLYFVEDMPHSLINPNQVRANSIPFCDDPIDPNRSLGFMDPETGEHCEEHIAFNIHGPYCSIKTRTPSADDIDTCRHIVLTSDLEWDRSQAEFNTMSATVSAVRSLNRYELVVAEISPTLSGPIFAQEIGDQVSSTFILEFSRISRWTRKSVVSAMDLAHR